MQKACEIKKVCIMQSFCLHEVSLEWILSGISSTSLPVRVLNFLAMIWCTNKGFMSNIKYPIKAYLISLVSFELKQKGKELCCTD